MSDIGITVSIISTIISFIAVITAICLSVIPEIYKKIKRRKLADHKIKHVYYLVNTLIEEYRFFNTKKEIINGNRYIAYSRMEVNYNIDIIGLLETIKEDIMLI